MIISMIISMIIFMRYKQSTKKDLKDDGHLQVKINGDDHLQVTIITIFWRRHLETKHIYKMGLTEVDKWGSTLIALQPYISQNMSQ